MGIAETPPSVPRLDIEFIDTLIAFVHSPLESPPIFDTQALVVVQLPYHSTPIPLCLNSFHLLNSSQLNSVRIARGFRPVTWPKRARDCVSSWRRSRTTIRCGSLKSSNFWAMAICGIEASYVILNIPRPDIFFPCSRPELECQRRKKNLTIFNNNS
jgi:hypothetical protein